MAFRMRIDWSPMTRLRQLLGKLPKVARDSALAQSEEVAKHLVDRSRLNAPVLSGDLRGSLSYLKPRLQGDIIVTGVGSDSPYGLRWHEEEFNLGPVSILQPGTVEGGVGNKYITRPMQYWRKQYIDSMEQSLRQSITKKKVIRVRIAGSNLP